MGSDFFLTVPDKDDQSANPDPLLQDSKSPSKLISIITQGRNDNYMGNFLWRLSTSLNQHARNIKILNAADDVELLVVDWGSEIPIYSVLDLTDEARALTRFLIVPPEIAKIYDADGGYSGVHPLNTVARRSRGRLIFFPDSDVIVPLESFAKLLYHARQGSIEGLSFDEYFFWASKYHIPNSLVQEEPSLDRLQDVISRDWQSFRYEEVNKIEFSGAGVGLLIHRDIWFESRGYDERLIYWGWYDIDWQRRLKKRYRWERLEDHGIRLFHLEHYAARIENSAQQLENKQRANEHKEPELYAPNPSNWGLRDHHLQIIDGFGRDISAADSRSLKESQLDLPQSVAAIAAQDPYYREVLSRTPLLQEAVKAISPIFLQMIEISRPRRIAHISIGTLGEHVSFFAALPFVEKVYCIDAWQKEHIPPATRADLSPHVQNNLYLQFLANIQATGNSAKTIPMPIEPFLAPDYCRKQGLQFDLLYFKDEYEIQGTRYDIAKWLDFITPETLVYGNGGPGHFSLYRLTEEFDDLLKARGLTHSEIGGYWCLLPEAIFTAMKPILQQEAMLYIHNMRAQGILL